ncbi:MAG: hypothetical protein MRT15_11730 [archaeon YNP-LCB-003-016]|uniref:hypothetical protein n=1 Tax=Candidatus Culexarchaeum yellowstonense TaxID=2928963 RepID=UPI0026EE14E9|nr:hypothetical protein [Candidatus Culexarchaeum yellowstonense]MCR6693055.1 hypothetical protein [Candidatus Culexarchaeum yellowstonense]
MSEINEEILERMWEEIEYVIFKYAFNKGRDVVIGKIAERPNYIWIEVTGPIRPESGLNYILISKLYPENVEKAYEWLKATFEYCLKKTEEVWGKFIKEMRGSEDG